MSCEYPYNVPSFGPRDVTQLGPIDARRRPHLELLNICSSCKKEK